MDYPKRDPYFAIRYLHALDDAGVIKIAGGSAAALIAYVVRREDRLRYQHAPTFWQSELMSHLDITQSKSFRRVRQRAIESGLLYFDARGTRMAARYWVLIPDWLQHRFPNQAAANHSTSGIIAETNSSQNGTNDSLISIAADTNGNGNGVIEDPNQSTIGVAKDPNEQSAESIGVRLGSDWGQIRGTLRPPFTPIPNPKEEECHDLGSRDASESSTKRKKAYTDSDRQTAVWMAETIRQSNPEGRKKSAAELDTWANDIRLIRERDSKSDSEIRSLFEWANEDDFWSANILSPGKLRKQWDQLAAKRKSSGRIASLKSSKPVEVELESL
jgi:hypothetical protein